MSGHTDKFVVEDAGTPRIGPCGAQGTLPRLQVNRRHVLPSFLRRQSVLPLEERQDWARSRK
jgi:hypothetical protein